MLWDDLVLGLYFNQEGQVLALYFCHKKYIVFVTEFLRGKNGSLLLARSYKRFIPYGVDFSNISMKKVVFERF